MKITQVEAIPFSNFLYVRIDTDEGVHGIGEASLSGRNRAVAAAFDHITPLLIGQDATRIEFIWQDLFRGTFWRGGPVLQSALAGVDLALWDLNGKALGVPRTASSEAGPATRSSSTGTSAAPRRKG